MSKNRAEQMVERLQNMQAAAPDIEASAIVSVDGLIMASALQQGVEEDRVSAMSAAMLSLGERISTVASFFWYCFPLKSKLKVQLYFVLFEK